MIDYIFVVLLGAFVGAISAFLGLGGGIVIVPLLPEIMSLSSHEAVATSLFTIFLVVSNNCIGFHKQKLIVWPIALVVGPLSAVGAYLSGRYAQLLPGEQLRIILALVVFAVFVRALLKILKKDVVDSASEKVDLKSLPRSKKMTIVGLGVFAGLLSGVSGIGAGLVISPLLLQLHLVKNDKVSPTANAVMIFTTLFGAIAFIPPHLPMGVHWGFIRLDIGILLAVSAFATSYFARKAQGRLPIFWRLSLLTGLLSLLLIKMVIEVIGF